MLIIALRLLERLGAASLGHSGFFMALLAATLLGTLICAEALNRFVENPGIALGRQSQRVQPNAAVM